MIPVEEGAVTVTSIGFGPGTIASAEHVTVNFDSVQRQVLPPDARENFTVEGRTIVTTIPNPLSLFRSSAMTWYVNTCCVATNRGTSIDSPTSTIECAKAEVARKKQASAAPLTLCFAPPSPGGRGTIIRTRPC